MEIISRETLNKCQLSMLSINSGIDEGDVLHSPHMTELMAAISRKNPMWAPVSPVDKCFQSYALRVFPSVHDIVPPEIEEIKMCWWRDKKKYNKEVGNKCYRPSFWVNEMVVGTSTHHHLESAFAISAIFFYLQFINSVDPKMDLVRGISVNDLDITVRARVGLINSGIKTIGDLENSTEKKIKTISGLGTGSFNVIVECLKEYGVSIGGAVK